MIREALLIPTPAGEIGAVITRPEGRSRMAAAILEGIGGRRFGVNGLWTRLADSLAEAGITVLRMDYPGRGDSGAAGRRRGTDLFGLETALGWFRDRTGDLDFIPIGVCFGARPAIDAVLRDPRARGLALVNPYLRTVPSPAGLRLRKLVSRVRGRGLVLPVDRRVVQDLCGASALVPVLALTGERDAWTRDLSAVRSRCPATPNLDVVTIPGIALHKHGTLAAQRATHDHILRWVVEHLLESVSR